jgi:thioredoxin reductase (NADPH)
MIDRAMQNPKIAFRWNTVVTEVLGEDKVEGIRVRDVNTDEESVVEASGFFVAIGHRPNTDIFKGQLPTKDNGYLITRDSRSLTDIEGVFACGDVQDDWYRQAVTAAGSGCMAAIDAERWLEEHGL